VGSSAASASVMCCRTVSGASPIDRGQPRPDATGKSMSEDVVGRSRRDCQVQLLTGRVVVSREQQGVGVIGGGRREK
jgi:hypothetical protein